MFRNRTRVLLAALAVVLVLGAAAALAASAKTYQVTGPVVEVNNDMIVVMKGKDRWEISRDSTSKVPADIKAGDKVTIHYRMIVTEVESKGAAKSGTTTKKKAA